MTARTNLKYSNFMGTKIAIWYEDQFKLNHVFRTTKLFNLYYKSVVASLGSQHELYYFASVWLEELLIVFD